MKPKNVDEYIDSFPDVQKAKLSEVRQMLRAALPDTHEMLKWGAPATVESNGMILVIFSGHKQHMNFVVTPSTIQAFTKELGGLETGKGAVRLSYDNPLPIQLLKKMALYRANEYRADGVNWK